MIINILFLTIKRLKPKLSLLYNLIGTKIQCSFPKSDCFSKTYLA